jgi:hypothetical protein
MQIANAPLKKKNGITGRNIVAKSTVVLSGVAQHMN